MASVGSRDGLSVDGMDWEGRDVGCIDGVAGVTVGLSVAASKVGGTADGRDVVCLGVDGAVSRTVGL